MSQNFPSLPKVSSASQGSWESERAVKAIFEPRFLTEFTPSRDFGVDGYLERLISFRPETPFF
jgi:hypothetical protein